MSIFKRADPISRPQPGTPPVAVGTRGTVPGTSIQVTNVTLRGGGDYFVTVSRHIQEINAFPVGQQLLQGLQNSGKNVLITYGGENVNQAAGTTAGYVILRKAHDQSDRVLFGHELDRMLNASGKPKLMIADELYRYTLRAWNGAHVANPFRAVRDVPPAPGNGIRRLPEVPPALIAAKLDQWIAGTVPLPSKDEMDILMMVLEGQVQRGSGVGTRISYDPYKTSVGGVDRPPQVALFHELTHAYYNAIGMQLGREDSISEANGGRLFELMAVGLPPFDRRPISENKFREAVSVAPRRAYP